MAKRTALGRFARGHRPWNDGTKGQGLSRPNRGSFDSPGRPGGKPIKPIGSRYWHAKDGEVFVKVAQPSRYAERYSRSRLTERECWRPERIVNFEAIHGPVVRGLQVRRLLPLCNCPDNLTLITPAVGAILNSGRWTKPKKPWSTLPADAEIRLAAVISAKRWDTGATSRARASAAAANPCASTATTTTGRSGSASDRATRDGNQARRTK